MQGRSRFVLAFARCFFKTVQKETPCSELVRVLKLPNKKLSAEERISGEIILIDLRLNLRWHRWLGTNFEDSNRLIGGNRDNGGLANVNYNWSENRNDNIAGRPLVVSKRASLVRGAL